MCEMEKFALFVNKVYFVQNLMKPLYLQHLYAPLTSYLYHNGCAEEGINLYSYSLDPENYQPKGSCNFSKIDDLVIELSLSTLISYNNPALLRVYNYNYNVLRITDGLSGLTFVN